MITTDTATPPLDFEGELTKADPALGRVIAAVVGRIGQQRIKPLHAAPFEALVRAIAYQSVSGKAAAVIFARLKEAVARKGTGLEHPDALLRNWRGEFAA